jgi:uncharacterized protein YegL
MKHFTLIIAMVAVALQLKAQPIFIGNRQNIGNTVNDGLSQVQPVFSADGGTLYFSQSSGVNQQYEIWKTISDSMGHIIAKEKIKALNPNINKPKFVLQTLSSSQLLVNGVYSIYKKQLLYSRGISVYNKTNTVADFSAEAFEKKTSKILDSLFKKNSFTPFYHPFFNVYIWSQASDGQQSDIYMLLADSNSTAKPKVIKLPSTINTAFDEQTPWLDDEGRYLYFASNKPGGLGETDIYVSERLDGSYTNWSTPKNLGPGVNSAGADYNFTIEPSGAHGYFVSEKNTLGKADIFRIKILQPDSTVLGFTPLLLPNEKPDTSLILSPNVHLPSSITFLLDVSHSMAQSRKMVLLKKSMYRLVQQLRAADKISIVIFGSGVQVALSGKLAKTKADIIDAIQVLRANGGSTNISAGLKWAYDEANKNYIQNGNNQLFVVTDGVFTLKPADEQLAIANGKITLTAVVVGNDVNTTKALEPLVRSTKGQMLYIKSEAFDLNTLLKNVRSNATKAGLKL